MDITNKAVKVSRRICQIEESLANGDLMRNEADQLRIELEELSELDELLNAYFKARNSADQIKTQLAELERQNAELVAQVEALRIAALNAIQQMSGGEAKADLRDAYDATPAQCLRDIQAEAGRASYQACLQNIGYHEPEWQDDANAYAERVKAGEA